MLSRSIRAEAPNDDKRWKIVNAAMRRNGDDSRALIESLHAVQECFGYLDEEALRYVAMRLGVPLSKAYGVATFYHYFTMKPPGQHTAVVCTGTACYIKGAQELLTQLEERFAVAPGNTTTDGKLSILTARCIGSCGLAPAVVVDGAVLGNVESKRMMDHIEQALQ